MSQKARIATWIILALVGLAWVALSVRYGLDSNTSPVLRYSMIALGMSFILGLAIWTWSQRLKRSGP